MAYRTQADADELFSYEAARAAEGWAPIAGYTDCNGNQFESFDEACRYYGVDTPAQVAAEDAYWAAEEAREEALREDNEALVYDVHAARYELERAARAERQDVFVAGLDLAAFDDECPF